MVMFTIFTIVHSLRGWLLNDFQWCCFSDYFWGCFLMRHSMLFPVFDVVTLWQYFGPTCSELYAYFFARFLYADMVVLDAWDLCVFSRLLFRLDIWCICLTFDPSRVLIWIHSDVYLKNVILLLERWNKIMLFFPRKKKIQMCLLL